MDSMEIIDFTAKDFCEAIISPVNGMRWNSSQAKMTTGLLPPNIASPCAHAHAKKKSPRRVGEGF
jgi:hypothetical protein